MVDTYFAEHHNPILKSFSPRRLSTFLLFFDFVFTTLSATSLDLEKFRSPFDNIASCYYSLTTRIQK